jgi:hypothetical protein
MPSPEHYHQRRPETPTTSPHLQAVITDLAAYYEVDLNKADARFSFVRPEQDKQWLIANLDGQHIDVARCPVATDDFMVPDIDVLLTMKPKRWETVKVLYTDAVWEAFAKAAAEKGQPPSDPQTNFPFGTFAEYVAQLIEEEIRLEQAREAAAVKAQLNLE